MKENEIKTWIEKYFEGLTSLEEEQKLRDYFQQENIPQEWEMYKPMFRYFASEREPGNTIVSQRTARNNVYTSTFFLRWGSVAAAACLLLFIGVRLFLNPGRTLPETSQAYVDGKRYTDIERIRTEALKSLENLSEGSDDAYSSQIEALEIFTK